MSDHLPDDLHQWPDDSFALLGIERSAEAKEARRAYLRLIRRFKPDHFPEHFQRIRAAYEAVQYHLEMRESYYAHWQAQAESSTDAEQEYPTDRDGVESAPTGFVKDDDAGCARAWGWAKEGRLTDAYAALLSLLERGERVEEVCLRLYWLLTTNPALDAQREPCDWLAKTLLANGLHGRPFELYQREIRWDRNEAVSRRCQALRDCGGEPAAVADLLAVRWPALSFLQRGDEIAQDLTILRDKVIYRDEAIWARLLLSAMDHLAWFPRNSVAERAFEDCRHELEEMTHLHQELDHLLDRMDLLIELINGWRRIGFIFEIPRPWVALIPLSWTQDFETIRPHLMPIIKAIADSPSTGLQVLDRIKGASWAVTTHLERLFQEAHQEPDAGRTDDLEAIERKVTQFLTLHGFDYSGYRQSLLQFCLREEISPEFVGNVAERRALMPHTAESRNLILSDGPLRSVYTAHHAIWG